MRNDTARQAETAAAGRAWARRACTVLGAYAFLGGLTSLAGWAFDIRRLTDWHDNGISIQPNAALCCTVSGLALLALAHQRRRAAAVAGAIVALVGGATLLEWLTGATFGIDGLLLSERTWGQVGVTVPGRMGPPSSVSFTVIGSALLLLAAGSGRWRRLALPGALLTLSISHLSITGYLYGADVLFTLPHLTVIALQTATFIAAISFGLLAAQPGRAPMSWLVDPGATGVVARRALPCILLLPLALGWLRLRGEEQGLYEKSFATAMMVLLLVGLLAALLAWCLAVIRRHEEALRDSASQVVDTLEGITDGCVRLDAGMRFVFVNSLAETLCGMRREQMLGRGWRELFPPAAGSRLELEYRRAMREQVPVQLEHYDPAWRRWFFVKAHPMPDGGLTVFLQDITRRKDSEVALRMSEARLAAQKEALELAVGGASLHQVLDRIVAAAREILGDDARTALTLVEAGGRGARREQPSGGDQPLARALEAWSSGSSDAAHAPHDRTIILVDPAGPATAGGPALDPGVRSFWSFPIRSFGGKVLGVLAASFPRPREPEPHQREAIKLLAQTAALVVERHRIAEALRGSEQRYRSLVSVITDVPWTADADGRFALPQPPWERYTGQSWDQHRDFGWIEAVHPDDREAVRARWQHCCATGELYEASARLWHAATASWRHVLARGTPVLAADGTCREWVGTCTDVHEQRTAQEALAEANRRKDEFLATLAHELRNPLSPIVNAIQLLSQAGDSARVAADARAIIHRQVTHLTRLVDDLLDVSRISRGKVELKKEQVQLGAVLRAAAETCGPLAASLRHEVTLSLPDEPLWVLADPVRLEQVFGNLIQNACKYTDPGGQVRVTAERAGEDAVVKVIDRGIGIPTESLAGVFDLFSQVGRSLERSHGGLGIGLHLVRQLVERHGGTVSARSEGPGRGSEFSVRLPLVRAPTAEPARRTEPPAAGSGPSRRILVVDDNRDAADSLGTLLGILGHQVRTANDGLGALRAAAEFRPEVVFLDIGMPLLNGYDTARALRREPWCRDVLLVAITGWGQQEDRRRSEEAGFDHHLVKPVAPDALFELLAMPPAGSADPAARA